MITTASTLTLVTLLAAATTGMPPITAPTSTVQFDAATGPVTVRSSAAVELPNAADYRVTFAELDTNNDGRVTRSEVPARHALSSEFKLVDRNHNGSISAQELANWR